MMIVFLGGSTNHPYGHYLAKSKEGMGDISLVGSQKASRGGNCRPPAGEGGP